MNKNDQNNGIAIGISLGLIFGLLFDNIAFGLLISQGLIPRSSAA